MSIYISKRARLRIDRAAKRIIKDCGLPRTDDNLRRMSYAMVEAAREVGIHLACEEERDDEYGAPYPEPD